ncbi:hypothetical protein [Cupriavidus basilensis]|jgi:hypothetical protein|uniref:hypothetical protein n=1 Tax=Cupriavidus basilensis TaxID=68895 RepID=UPI0023E7EB1C|nr:hypothetical protein [Cupriavidus basilensis]MDF3883129.1 hypothetical protein [Cupriavidus basilensis]
MSGSDHSSTLEGAPAKFILQQHAADIPSVSAFPTRPTWSGVLSPLLDLYKESVEPDYVYSELSRMAKFADVSADVNDDLLQIIALAAANNLTAVRAVALRALRRSDAVPPSISISMEPN